MADSPHEIHIALAEFDRTQLPAAQQQLSGDAFRRAVQDHLAREFILEQGAAEVIVTADRIIIRWDASPELKSLTSRGIELLQAGDYDRGMATLEAAIQRNPNDADALLNLGIALSDRRRTDEALRHLERLLALEPELSRGWVAAGVAHARGGRSPEAIDAFRRAIGIDPGDAYARKNLGAMLIEEGNDIDEAMAHLLLAAQSMPGDQQVWFNLGRAWERRGDPGKAEDAHRMVLQINSTNQLAGMAEARLTHLAEAAFRGTGGLRPDALEYCRSSLRLFDGMPRPEVQKITFEIATLGTRGLDVSSPEKKYTLRSLPGTFSGLHLLCIEYAGFKIIDPSVDIRFDLSKEYEIAQGLHGRGK